MIQEDNNFYDDYPFKYGYSSKSEIIKNMHPFLKELIELSKSKIITDVGCGCGRNLLYASKFAYKLIGIDLSRQSLDFINSFIKSKNLHLIQADNLNLPLEENSSDLVISDGVIHHTGDTFKAFKECIRILKDNGFLYLAVYKKFRYYPFLYFTFGFFLRLLNKTRFGHFIMENTFVLLHYMIYKIFKNRKLILTETRSIFYDYFITPIATFHSKSQIKSWILDLNCTLEKYDRTSGNCHVFIIRKNEK